MNYYETDYYKVWDNTYIMPIYMDSLTDTSDEIIFDYIEERYAKVWKELAKW